MASDKSVEAPMLLQSRSMSNRLVRRQPLPSNAAGFSMIEMMVVLAFVGTIAAIALPMMSRALASIRLNGAIRSISNTAAVTKTKAGAQFTRARLYIDRGANSYHVETWVPGALPGTGNWVADGGDAFLPANVTFKFNPVGSAPTNTQPVIGHAPPCLDNNSPPAAIANTSCIVFNSRGIPINDNGAPTTADAVYISDGSAVLGNLLNVDGGVEICERAERGDSAWVRRGCLREQPLRVVEDLDSSESVTGREHSHSDIGVEGCPKDEALDFAPVL